MTTTMIVTRQTPVRYRKARSDGRLSALARSMEKERGLPEGSVRIVSPSGRKMRGDASVRTLKARWDE